MQAALDHRFAKPTLYAALFTFGIFWTMHLLIEGGKYLAGENENLATVDFVRLKKEADLETRERKKPPKPEPPKQPPPPKMKIDTPPPDAPPTPFQMPKLNLPTNISGGPFLGAYVGGDLSGYSELIPLMRINPQYPRQALRDGISGWVDFEVIVNADGTVKSARPVKAQPRGVFETAAMQAILKWKFKPKVVDGKGVEQKAIQRIDFNLEKDN
ncbi:MAG TPA: energy transducer TonB [Verrucomicrobiae bacterium]|nr:energy transducer TonB [Verrucomicrobiae bacterium]